MNLKNIFVPMGALFLVLLLAGCSASKDVANKDVKDGFYPGTVKVGHLVALDMAPMFVAKEAGYFQDEGIDLETVFFSNPGDNNTALAGGSIQFSINPFTLPYLGVNSGVPMEIISSAGGLGVIQVVIQSDYEVTRMEELAQWVKNNPEQKLKVGALRGDTLDMILYKSFKEVGLTYDDFEMIWFNDLLAMVQSFKSKDLAILSHIKPYTTDLEVNYNAKALTDNAEVWGKATPNTTVAILHDFGIQYPETVKAYLRAVHKGFEMVVNNPDQAIALLKDKNYYAVSDDVLLEAFKSQKDVVLKPDVDGMMMAINDMVDQGYIEKPSSDIVNMSFLDAIGSK